jgi:hypothetical protein
VTQAFISLHISEDTQTLGRTARQGNLGSYSVVLLYSELEAIEISVDRIREFEKKGQRKKIAAISRTIGNEKMHEEFQPFRQALLKSDTETVREFIRSSNYRHCYNLHVFRELSASSIRWARGGNR